MTNASSRTTYAQCVENKSKHIDRYVLCLVSKTNCNHTNADWYTGRIDNHTWRVSCDIKANCAGTKSEPDIWNWLVDLSKIWTPLHHTRLELLVIATFLWMAIHQLPVLTMVTARRIYSRQPVREVGERWNNVVEHVCVDKRWLEHEVSLFEDVFRRRTIS